MSNMSNVTAKQIIDTMANWVGLKRSDKSHKVIIDTYNSYIKTHPGAGSGYLVKYTDPYCDTTVSAAFVKNNAVDLIGGIECGCERHIALFKKKGIWEENGRVIPEPGWLILYNWDDSTQPNDGGADHIGIVESVNKSKKTITLIEGNLGDGVVGRRTISIGWGYIRGYAKPKYAKSSKTTTTKKKTDTGQNKASQGGAGKSYTVKQGDTLSEIAQKYDTTVQVLVDYNSIKDANKIKVGQVINIPSTKFFKGCRVRVKKSAKKYATGETIARFVKGSTYKVKQVGSDRLLLEGINSWVLISDVTLL